MTDNDPGHDPDAAARAAMDQAITALRPILTAVTEARESFKTAGFSNASADAMAAELYRVILHKAFGL